MDPLRQLRLVRRHWWIVLVTLMVSLGVTALVTVRAQPRYLATVTYFVTTPSQGVSDAYQGGLFLQQRVKSYEQLLTSDRLARSVVADNQLGLTAEQVRGRISTSTETGTVLLRASVVDTDQTRALRVTEAVSAKFVELVKQVETRPDGSAGPIKIEVISGPGVTPSPVSPQPVRNVLIGTLIGLLAGVGLAILRGIADLRVRDGASLRRVTDSPLLGEIPLDNDARTAPLIIGVAAASARAEAIRKLRTNLRFVDADEPARVIAITSALQGEGKTTLSCNLAITLAEAGWRVLLVDADLRRSKVGDYLGIDSAVGLTDVLVGDVPVGDVVQRWGDKSLLVLPAGSAPPNPSELLGSKAMADLLLALRESADIVIIDTAPLLAVTDGVVVAVQADGALLISQHGRTARTQVAAAARALNAVSVRLLGCVLNMAKLAKAEAYQYEAYQVLSSSLPVDRATAGRHAEQTAADEPVDNAEELTRLSR
ncbi:polysaccharide biosynthesis tyrosine autokinase [Micromonospora endophytica]|uniref:Protein tyrosine kinase n=1 Tax=Micromonospora endophytica TaxID=515350 RepID=A0A2W2CFC8_9ACTN|nr:polysaccharide biosynthesis tyrosine autokinase [Micromonospora endophytica]PZF90468.1 protein tyrosine kinase [Micromonospora endophytica]RIW48272.1 polysaccharide biosynthesis tyrosine autokinase [Micromonospora endophytica]BCJ56664.1 chromosome partitioning protein [Micromonospora endophytica]